MPPPDAPAGQDEIAVGRMLERIAGRERLAIGLEAAAIACGAGGLTLLLLAAARLPLSGAGATAFVIGAAGGAWWVTRARPRATPRHAADLVERARPDSRNVVRTLAEMQTGAPLAGPWMRARVARDAAAVIGRLSPAEVVDVRRAAILCSVGVLLAAVTGVAVSRVDRASVARSAAVSAVEHAAAAGAFAIDVTVTPPAYTTLPERREHDPDRLEIVEGSRVAVRVTGAPDVNIRYNTEPVAATAGGDGVHAAIAPGQSGYVAVEPARGGRRLIPVVVTPDRSPTVAVTAPGKDLLVPQATGRVAVTARATDDFGLRTFELAYTRVSGSGEQFEFTTGSLPLAITRESSTAWAAAAAFQLETLKLEPGDTLVYRVLARDARPGDAGLASSDTFFVEIAGPGMVALPGFELPPEGERYALSQQMIVLKIQRLRAREARMAREALEEEAAGIAAEQRAVRANFIFLLGGRVEDEEEEAEQSSEIQEGRLQNSARREINAAIGHMGDAERALAVVDTATALPAARAAADALQRAFGRNRYFLRTVPVRSRIDPSRRLSGDLTEARDWRRPATPSDDDETVIAARDILAALLALDPARLNAGQAADLASLAERALAVDPGSADWQRISAGILSVRDGVTTGAPRAALVERIQGAVTPLAALVRQRSPRAGDRAGDAVLRGAWADEVRR